MLNVIQVINHETAALCDFVNSRRTRTHPLHAALPHAEVGLLEVGDLDCAVAAVVIPVRLEPAVLMRVTLPLAAFYMMCHNSL